MQGDVAAIGVDRAVEIIARATERDIAICLQVSVTTHHDLLAVEGVLIDVTARIDLEVAIGFHLTENNVVGDLHRHVVPAAVVGFGERHQALEVVGCEECRVLTGTGVSNKGGVAFHGDRPRLRHAACFL